MICENKDSEKEMAQDTAEGRTETEGTDVAMPPAAAPEAAPASEEATENSCRSEEDEKKETAAPKVFNRKISVVSAKVTSQPAPPPATGNDEPEAAIPARKRRWGASTATMQKKPSISITTESLKNLIPDIKPVAGQDVVLDLHADDTHISEDENEGSSEESSHDKGLKICRTVTQVVQPDAQENGKAAEEENEPEEDPRPRPLPPPPPPEAPLETEVPPPVAPEIQKVTLTDTLIRRSISQQKTGVSITIDDPVRTSHVPSPPRFKVNTIVHISNLVRPFTLGQLKELLGRTGTLIEEGFWIDKIKSHCYVTYSTLEEAIATRNSLHGVKWPQSNPKFLFADYAEQNELDFHKGLLVDRPQPPKVEEPPRPRPPPQHPRMLPPPALMHRVPERPERSAREQWAEREREMERRERTRAEREWDRDKVREAPPPPRSRSRSRDRRRKERAKSKEKKSEKKEKAEKAQEEPPAKLLDDLFRKTKAAPCIYWLPLTLDQIVKNAEDRAERAKEREKRREEEERKERLKEREAERARELEREKRQEHSRDRGGRENLRDAKRRSRSRSTPVRDRGGRR